MIIPETVMCENHLKNEYAVESGADSVVITSTSCYWVVEETLWLISQLPELGGKRDYLDALSKLGLLEAQKIFDKLISIGVLRVKNGKRLLKDILGLILCPQIKLVSCRLQEKFLAFLGIRLSMPGLKKFFYPVLVAAVLGMIWGVALIAADPRTIFQYSSPGKAHVWVIFSLILLGSLLHELGHSFAAAAGGIGLRPIGFSVYLFYPVFYTNVSGMEKLRLWKKLAVDCGGIIPQAAYLFVLLLVCEVTKNASFIEAVRWISVIIAFNLNPLLRTDGYWLYHDLRGEFKESGLMSRVHYVYLAAFVIFSIYFMGQVYARLGSVTRDIVMALESPRRLFSEGYKIILGCYFIIIAFVGGLRRLKESHREWVELRKNHQLGNY